MEKKYPAFFLFYLLYWMAAACVNPYLTLFLESRGLDGVEVGAVLAVFNLAGVLGSILVGLFVDRSGAAKAALYIMIAGMFVAVALMFAAGYSFPVLLATALVYGFVSLPNNDIADRSLIDRLGRESNQFSRYRLGGSIGYGVGILLAGLLLKRSGLGALFCAFLLLTAANGFNIRGLFTGAREVHAGRPPKIDWKLMLQGGRLYPYLAMTVFGLTETGAVSFTALHLASVGLDPILTSVFVAVSMIGEFAAFLVLPQVLARLGPWRAIMAGFFIQCLRLFSFTLAGTVPLHLVLLLQAVGGSSFAFVYAAVTRLVSARFKSGMKTVAQSLKTVANKGLGAGAGSLFIGWMYKYRTTTEAFYFLAGLSLLSVLLLAGLLWRRGREK